ncbi:MAG: alpha amylase N-terminal ig-like domain-containing protein, partial [Streptococcaceae bacterium]|nr:alpha amylase N-terminal ig-like domain-containing protein [Streptococcaceae bacterium]
MNTSAIYHRPESEFAYLYQPNMMHIRLRTAKEDIKTVKLLAGDPYNLHSDAWISRPQLMEKYLTTDLHDYWLIETTAPFKRLSYAFELTGNSGEVCFYGDHGVFPPEEQYYFNPNNYFRLPYFHEIDRVKVPEWIKQTVWYQIFPERFANGDTTNDPAGTLPWDSNRHPERQDFFGGDLEGVIAHLDHLVELGINGIYFCPIFKAHSNHKYDTIDYKEIDPDFGDKKTFKRLVDACHARGIKVMLDAVFNHMGDTSPQWQDVLANGENSKYADWFHVNQYPAVYTQTDDFEFSGDASYDTFAFTPHMPKLNTANPEVINFLLDI